MTEEAKVTSAYDNGEKQQWGRNRLYFRDGAKWTLRKKTVSWLTGCVFTGLGVVQVIINESKTNSPSLKPPPTPNTQSRPTVTFEEFAKLNAAGAQRNPVKRSTAVKLTGQQVILRPRVLKIPPGTMANAQLVSGGSNGLVRAELTESILHSGENLLESGAVLVGRGTSTEDRLHVTFTQAVFRDGNILPIQAEACDSSDRMVGLKGSKVGSKAVNIAGSIGLGFIGGFSEGLQDTHGQAGVAVRPPTIRNALLNATGTTALEQSRNLMSDLKDKRPTIEVPAGQSICVIFEAN